MTNATLPLMEIVHREGFFLFGKKFTVARDRSSYGWIDQAITPMSIEVLLKAGNGRGKQSTQQLAM